MKRVLAINDISCFGKCSLTIALPVMSALGVEICPLPTALLSAHTGINGFYKYDLTNQMREIYSHFVELKIDFDCVYSGYIASADGIEIVRTILKDNKDKLVIVDPVMGDNGIPYKTHTKEICDSICSLINYATVITPNLTEAAIILNKPFPTKIENIEIFKEWLIQLSKFCEIPIITGICINEDIYNICFDRNTNKFFEYKTKKVAGFVSGTGDLFASCFTAYFLNSHTIMQSLKFASLFVYEAVSKTVSLNKNINEGIAFEPILKELFNEKI